MATGLKGKLKRLRLREGDIIVVRDEDTLRALTSLAQTGGAKGLPNCPIIRVKGSIHRLSKEYLAKLTSNPNYKGDEPTHKHESIHDHL